MKRKIVKFFATGLLAAGVEYGTFALLFTLGGFNLFASNSISFGCGFLVSFLLNKHWVFSSKNGAVKELTKYALLAMINLGISNIAIYGMTEILHADSLIAKFLTMGVIAAWNYIIFSQFIFGNKTNNSL